LEEALQAGAKLILLDNFDLEGMREAVHLTAGRAALEASGGISLDKVRAIAETGVDPSVGWASWRRIASSIWASAPSTRPKPPRKANPSTLAGERRG
jgi:hypothetical protein